MVSDTEDPPMENHEQMFSGRQVTRPGQGVKKGEAGLQMQKENGTLDVAGD